MNCRDAPPITSKHSAFFLATILFLSLYDYLQRSWTVGIACCYQFRRENQPLLRWIQVIKNPCSLNFSRSILLPFLSLLENPLTIPDRMSRLHLVLHDFFFSFSVPILCISTLSLAQPTSHLAALIKAFSLTSSAWSSSSVTSRKNHRRRSKTRKGLSKTTNSGDTTVSISKAKFTLST